MHGALCFLLPGCGTKLAEPKIATKTYREKGLKLKQLISHELTHINCMFGWFTWVKHILKNRIMLWFFVCTCRNTQNNGERSAVSAENSGYVNVMKCQKQAIMPKNMEHSATYENSQTYVVPDSPVYANVNPGYQPLLDMSDNPSYVSSQSYNESMEHVTPAYLSIHGSVLTRLHLIIV